ncbi:VOC family protein [Listeria fleischmannii]|jgi:predicted lactoylglutathione lyase|uniref:Glyoxalase/bleomycin resistance/extradiol dioxygenase family protein n=1 Tax=Listeria fleischmannii TaxID=1069827 RepID=A0A841YF26_9LIST|nr:VOC family protein [Listeria fleischmannii]EIA20609.1 glyoxalase/bleomycin resistance protein/dioxygenase [Listeria fleischmannii subsp. coloradonensis]MBC1398697.1 glyoxalase/bleomycin resistance/extradiol dioxygenase family protein [Listeria fleischmannii]MBC1418186.1 glyoxalase/bleomycin resistance/extradiol dioxygenase family protein [Listeria fleischmannii]MBC1426959.1 glyoxalase/bleomycin resistance/extradiol dioxygenase family protein [Listeria fleischmannii]STY35958.1 Predicted lact
MPNVKMTFINLPVKDLNESIAFYTELGFKFNPDFTDENATCMIINDTTFAMLLVEPFFKQFLPSTEIADYKTTTSVINALSFETRDEVDELYEKAINAGAKKGYLMDEQGMYSKSFHDINGHILELFHMDMNSK